MTAEARPRVTVPRDVRMEAGYLGACLLASTAEAQREMLGMVEAGDLWSEPHREVWHLLRRMSVRGLVDLPALVAEAVGGTHLEALGGLEVLTTLSDHAPTAYHVAAHAAQLRELGRRRALAEWAERLRETACDTAVELDRVEATVSGVPEDGRARDEGRWHDPVATAEAMLADVCAAHDAGAPLARERFPSGIPRLDRDIALGRGQVCVIAGRPSMGKSALAQQWATHSARRGASVVYVSLEMPARLIAERHVAQLHGIPWREFAHRAPTSAEVAMVSAGLRDWAELGVRVDDRGGPTVEQLCRALRAAHRQRPVDIFVIDHIGLINLGKAGRYEGITQVSNALLGMAKELDCAAILLSQLSRAHAGRSGMDAGVPRLSDLRDSGAIEQDADIVLGVLRPSMDVADDPAPDLIAVLKARSSGAGGRVLCDFIGQKQLWVERDKFRDWD